MIGALVITIIYLALVLGFLAAFTAPKSKKTSEEYVSIDDLLNDEE